MVVTFESIWAEHQRRMRRARAVRVAVIIVLYALAAAVGFLV